ncbi:MAG: hypothetical protein ACRDFW_13385 [bacterium]
MTIVPPKVSVSPRELRRMFNEGRYAARAAQGEFTTHVVVNGHPTSPRAPVPFCTRSQEIVLRDRTGREVVAWHQYLKPDGTLGASGQPDPKRLLKDGVLYVRWWEPRSG